MAKVSTKATQLFSNCTCCLLVLRHGVPERQLVCLASCWPRQGLTRVKLIRGLTGQSIPYCNLTSQGSRNSTFKSIFKMPPRIWHHPLHLNMQLDPVLMALNGQSLNKSHTAILKLYLLPAGAKSWGTWKAAGLLGHLLAKTRPDKGQVD